MAALSSANIKYTAEELAKVSGISAETMANWGLTQSTDSLTMSQLAELASSDAQAKKVLEKIIAQNAQKVANGEITASNIGLAASEGTATLATGSFTTAIKANISAMWTWMTTTPLGWLTLLVAGVFTAIKAYDLFTVSVDEQREAMEESISAYETARSELSSITSELESNEKAMSELLAKDKLTFAEKGQLEELKEINAELRIQKDLQEKNVDKEKKNSAIEAAKLYKKQFGNYDISSKKIDEYEQNADLMGNNAILISDEDDISSMLAGYRQFIELREQAFKDRDQYNIDHFTELTSDIKENLFETAQELQTQKDAMSDYYNALKDIPYDNLTSEQKEVVDAYNKTSEAILLIYKELDRATWNELQFSKVTQEFSDTTQELQRLGKEGKVTAEMLNDPKYDAFIQKLIDIEFISDDTEGSLRFVASAFNGTMQSAENYLSTLDSPEAFSKFINNLDGEAKALGTTKEELATLIGYHLTFDNTSLKTDDKIKMLNLLQTAIGNTSAEMKYLLTLFNVASGNFDTTGMTDDEVRARRAHTKHYLKNKYGFDFNETEIPEKDPYVPSGGGDKGSSKDNTPDYEDPTDAIINRINLRAKELEQQEESIQNAIEIAELEKDYKKQISLTNDLISNRKSRIEELTKANAGLHNEAEWLRNSNSWDEESWFDSQGNATEEYYKDFNSATKEQQEQIKDLFESLSKYKKAYMDNAEEVVDLNKEILQDEKKILDIRREELEDVLSEMERYVDLIKDSLQDTIDHYENLRTKEEAVLSVMQKQFDIQNELSDAAHEANKAIATSRVAYEYLDKDLYSQIYNEEDYNKVKDKIADVGSSVDTLTNKFISDINNAYANDQLYLIESITAEYERQCDLKERELEILQAEINLQKKQDKLNNVLAEHNVRMLVDGQWKWTHNVDDARQATEELADAQYQADTLREQQKQQNALHQQQLMIDNLGNTIGSYEHQITLVEEATSRLSQTIDKIVNPISDVGKMAEILANEGVSKINMAFNGLLKVFSSFTGEDYGSLAISVPTSTSAMSLTPISNGEKYIVYNNLKYKEGTSVYDNLLKKGLGTHHYATGTKSALRGLAEVNEILPEGIMTKDGRLIPMANLGGGEMIFNHGMMENLWHQSQIPWNILTPNVPSLVNKQPSVVDQSIHIDKVDVNEPADFDGFLQELNAKARTRNAISNRMRR